MVAHRPGSDAKWPTGKTMSASDRVNQLFVVSAGVELFDVVHAVRGEHPFSRYASPDEILHDLVGRTRPSPIGKHLVKRIVVFEPSCLRRESLVILQVGAADGLDDGCPVRIVSD